MCAGRDAAFVEDTRGRAQTAHCCSSGRRKGRHRSRGSVFILQVSRVLHWARLLVRPGRRRDRHWETPQGGERWESGYSALVRRWHRDGEHCRRGEAQALGGPDSAGGAQGRAGRGSAAAGAPARACGSACVGVPSTVYTG